MEQAGGCEKNREALAEQGGFDNAGKICAKRRARKTEQGKPESRFPAYQALSGIRNQSRDGARDEQQEVDPL